MSHFTRKVRVMFLMLLAIAMIGAGAKQAEAATNMVSVAVRNTQTGGKLVKNKYGYRFLAKNGKYVKNKWSRYNKSIYYFKANGYANRGWVTYEGQKYYFDQTGKLVYGKFLTLSGKTYYMHSSGRMLKNTWVKIKGNFYRVSKDGVLCRGKSFYVGSKLYYADTTGVIVKNKWVTIGSRNYYFGSNGVWVPGAKAANATTASKVTTTATSTATSTAVSAAKGKYYLFVGDSRTVGMDTVVSRSGVYFLAKVSMGYNWMTEVTDAKVKSFIAKHPNCTVVYAFGVNDVGNVDRYISYYKSMISAFPNVNFRFMAVNPINEKKYRSNYSGNLTNKMIRSYNAKLKNAVGAAYVDTYTFLCKNNPVTVDGLHYNGASYLKLYNWVMSKVA